jgi:hypothetical protein
MKLGRKRGDTTPWDDNFEHEFGTADGHFPEMIRWLEALQRKDNGGAMLAERFLAHPVADERLVMLTECVMSLAVRSPMNRTRAVSVAEHLRGEVSEPERDALIGLNLRSMQRALSDAIGARAKFAVVFSPKRELHFGDGFFSNVRDPRNGIFLPRIFAPITPSVGVLITRPFRYLIEPKLTTIVATAAETDALNDAIQVYAASCVFFRSEVPSISEAFRSGKHLVYSGHNTIDELINSLPGVRSNTLLDGPLPSV